MARSKEFDERKAVADAMGVFWRKGYYATSMEDLVEATDVQRYGLYSSFESKHGIFLAVLDHYHETVITRNLSGLEVNGAGLAEVRAFFDWLLRIVLAPGPSKGCLLCNTGIEVAPVDAEAATRVDRYIRRLTSAFQTALANSQQRGEVAITLDVAQQAQFLASVVLSTMLQARAQLPSTMVETYVRVALSTLG